MFTIRRRAHFMLVALPLFGMLFASTAMPVATSRFVSDARSAVTDVASAVAGAADIETAEAGCMNTWDGHYGLQLCISTYWYLGTYSGLQVYRGWFYEYMSGKWFQANFVWYGPVWNQNVYIL